jgi:putative thiamine transport system permease protein
MASAGALLQLGVTLTALATWWCLERLVRRLGRSWVEGGRAGAAIGCCAAGKGLILLPAPPPWWGSPACWRSTPWPVSGAFPMPCPRPFTLQHWQRALPLAGPANRRW